MGIFRRQQPGLFERDRYRGTDNSATCEHPRQSAELRVSTDRRGRQTSKTVAYCLDCGAEWGA